MRRTSSKRSIGLFPNKNGRFTGVIENSKVRISRHSDTSTKAQMAKIMVQYGRSSRSSWTKSVRSSFGRTILGKAIRESSMKKRLGKSSKLGFFFVNWERGLFLSVYVDDVKLAGKKQNINPTWKVPMKDVDLEEPTSFLDHVYSGCTQRWCQKAKILSTIAKTWPIPGFLLELWKVSGKLDENTISSWSYDMEGHAKRFVERHCELANKTTQHLHKVATPCLDDHQFQE